MKATAVERFKVEAETALKASEELRVKAEPEIDRINARAEAATKAKDEATLKATEANRIKVETEIALEASEVLRCKAEFEIDRINAGAEAAMKAKPTTIKEEAASATEEELRTSTEDIAESEAGGDVFSTSCSSGEVRICSRHPALAKVIAEINTILKAKAKSTAHADRSQANRLIRSLAQIDIEQYEYAEAVACIKPFIAICRH